MPEKKRTYYDRTEPLPRYKTVVCVTDQRNCDRIIRAGRVLADFTDTELAVINCASPSQQQDPGSIEYLFEVSRSNGAEMSVFYQQDSARAIIRYIKEHKVANVLTGLPGDENSVLYRLWERFSHVQFYVVDAGGRLQPAQRVRGCTAAVGEG